MKTLNTNATNISIDDKLSTYTNIKKIEILKAYIHKKKNLQNHQFSSELSLSLSPKQKTPEKYNHINSPFFGRGPLFNHENSWWKKAKIYAGESQTPSQKRLTDTVTFSYKKKLDKKIAKPSLESDFEYLDRVKTRCNLPREWTPEGYMYMYLST